MRNIGVIWIGHQDYLCDNTSAIQRAAYESIRDLPFVSAQRSPIAVSEAETVAAVRDTLVQQDCCGALIVLATWVECNVVMAALKELRGRPCMFWGFPLEEVDGRRESTGSYVSASMFAGVVKRLGLPCPTLYASWKDPEAQRAIDCFSRAAGAIDALFYARIGLFGYTSMSIYTGTFDHVLMRYQIGPEIEQMDTYSLLCRSEAVSDEDAEHARARLLQLASCHPDVQPHVLQQTMKMYVALRQLCQEHHWDAVNVKCQYELSKEYKLTPCVALSLLADDGIVASCEGDILNTVSMLLLHYLSSQEIWYGDSLTHWGNTLQFSPCGFLPFRMALGQATVLSFQGHPGFNGIKACGVLRPGKITWLRLVEDIGSYHLIYGTGSGIETSPRGGDMPALNVVLDGDMQRLCQQYAGQHFAITYGDWSQELETFASLMGLEARRI